LSDYIKKTALVSNSDGNVFRNEVGKWIDEYQLAGLSVDIQYQMSMGMYSAFIVAR
jgi:hypothetical protein